MEKLTKRVRDILYAAASSEGVFLFVSFMLYGFGRMQTLDLHSEARRLLDLYVVVPWGMALVLLRLGRARKRIESARADIKILFMLLLWITVPFIWRFGFKEAQAITAFRYTVIFFGLYASLAEHRDIEREMDWASTLFASASFIIAGALLYCAVTVKVYGTHIAVPGFGVNQAGNLVRLNVSLNPNTTAMLEGCCALMCLLGAARRKHLWAKMAHLIPAVMMAAALVLTQGRTARYALIGALAVGTYGVIACGRAISKKVYRQLTAIAAAAAVLVGGYVGADLLTRQTMNHFERHPIQVVRPDWYEGASGEQTAFLTEVLQMMVPEALADETQAAPEATPAPEYVVREGIDSTLSMRTVFWKNLLGIWKENPKDVLLGFGIERMQEVCYQAGFYAPVIDNAILHFITSFGLIGFLLLCAFFVSIAKPVLRVFFAPPEKSRAGDRVLCMIVVYELLVSMMESQTLIAMEAINIVFFFALGLLVKRGRKLAEA